MAQADEHMDADKVDKANEEKREPHGNAPSKPDGLGSAVEAIAARNASRPRPIDAS
jgi:hypothetical protein